MRFALLMGVMASVFGMGCIVSTTEELADGGQDSAALDGEVVAEDSLDSALDATSFDSATDATLADSSLDTADATDGPATPLPCVVDGVEGECVDIDLCTGDLIATPGHCPGAKDIQCCTPRPTGDAGPDTRDSSGDVSGSPDGWCATDPTAKPNEGLREEIGARGCPDGMVRIEATPAFCVDKFEGSVALVLADGSFSPWSPYYPPPTGKKYRALSLRGAVPQGYISGAQAQLACENAGKRLCTNAEWLRGCQGPAKTTYPYGSTRKPGVCNDARSTHPAAQCFGTSASWIYSELDWPGINQQPITVDRTGVRGGCVTAEGAYDMMGNLHEWIYDDPTKYTSPVKAIDFRGGFYADTSRNGEGCLYRTTAHSFSHWDYSTGFRCCADAR